jgi:hypothetical protein
MQEDQQAHEREMAGKEHELNERVAMKPEPSE